MCISIEYVHVYQYGICTCVSVSNMYMCINIEYVHVYQYGICTCVSVSNMYMCINIEYVHVYRTCDNQFTTTIKSGKN